MQICLQHKENVAGILLLAPHLALPCVEAIGSYKTLSHLLQTFITLMAHRHRDNTESGRRQIAIHAHWVLVAGALNMLQNDKNGTKKLQLSARNASYT
jgi:hypothetical protein